MIRTTVVLDENIFKEAKKYAIDKKSAFGTLVNLALKNYLQGRKKLTEHKFQIKVYQMGRIKGNLSRTEIYEAI